MLDSLLEGLNIQPLEDFAPIDDGLPQAAVMILIKPGCGGENDLQLVMAKKTAHLRKHAGEVVFPGGKLELGETHLHAALRECEEEIGLAADSIDVVGCLSRQVTRYDVAVYPFVALLQKPVEYRLDSFEIESVFDIPVSYLSQPENVLQETVEFKGKPKVIDYYQYQQYKIWGVTALMIKELVGCE